MIDSRENANVLDDLLLASGGRPVIQIVIDPEDDVVSIRAAGLDGAAVPDIVLRLGKALTGSP
jgi:hypothetical protein